MDRGSNIESLTARYVYRHTRNITLVNAAFTRVDLSRQAWKCICSVHRFRQAEKRSNKQTRNNDKHFGKSIET